MYLIYCTLNAHVSWSDGRVLDALRSKLRPGVTLTKQQERGILREHHDAQALYGYVMGGCR
jgi:hypothetical protein